MADTLKPFDVVALTVDQPSLGLVRGQVGTVVDQHAPSVYEVEFADDNGKTYATGAVGAEHLMPLRYAPPKVA